MSRYPSKQIHDRTHGPGVGAPGDALGQGQPYGAVIATAPEGSKVYVTIPALHLTQTFQARINHEAPVTVGQTCLVLFDEQKLPWVIAWL